MSIKTWQEHLESTVSDMQIVSSLMIQQAMQDEIDSLRDALKKASNLDVHRRDHIETLHTERDQLAAALEATTLKEAELTGEVYTLRKVLGQALNAMGIGYTGSNFTNYYAAITAIQDQLK